MIKLEEKLIKLKGENYEAWRFQLNINNSKKL